MADCGSSHYGVILDSGGKTVSKCVPLNDLSAEVLMEDIDAAMEEGASTFELLRTAAAVSNALNNVAANRTSLVFPNASTVREQLLEALANSTSIDSPASSPAAILSLASVASSIEKLTRVPTETTIRSAVLAVELLSAALEDLFKGKDEAKVSLDAAIVQLVARAASNIASALTPDSLRKAAATFAGGGPTISTTAPIDTTQYVTCPLPSFDDCFCDLLFFRLVF